MPKKTPLTIKRFKVDLFVIAACFIFSSWLMHHTFQYRDSQFLISSKLWSDFAAHIPLIRSFSLGDNIPIQYPTFPGEPIRYHFLFYAVVALLEKAGLNLVSSLNLLSSLGLSLLLIMIYFYGRLIFRRRLAGMIAIILFLFNGSLSFWEFFNQHPLNPHSLVEIITNTRFPSFGPWDGQLIAAFWNLNIYTNQRHLGLSFGLGLLTLYPLLLALYRNIYPKIWITFTLGLIMFFMPWLHQAAAVMVLTMSALILVINLKTLRVYLPTFLIMFVCSMPGILYYALLGGKNLSFHLGFLSPQTDILFLLKYWFFNLGFYVFLLPLLFFWHGRKNKTVLLSAASLFVIANFIKLSPDMINNHKLINFFMIFINLFMAGFLIFLWRKNLSAKLLAVLAFLLLTFSGVIDLFPIINDYHLKLADVPLNPTAVWIRDFTPKDSVFLTTAYLYNPASLAGRKTFLDYGYFNWSMGYDEHTRRALIPQLFSPNLSTDKLCLALLSQSLSYIFIAPGRGDLGDVDPQASAIARLFIPSFTASDGATIYSVAQNCY